MARSKNINHYPKEMLQVIDIIHKAREYKIPTSGMKESLSIRAQFYAMFKALSEEVKVIRELLARGNRDKAIELDQNDYLHKSNMADQLIIQAHEDHVRFIRRSDTPLAQKLRDLFGVPGEMIGQQVIPKGQHLLEDITKEPGKSAWKWFEKEGPAYFGNDALEDLPNWAREAVREYRAQKPSQEPQNDPESINWDKVISKAQGPHKKSLGRWKKLYERSTELFGKYRKENDN